MFYLKNIRLFNFRNISQLSEDLNPRRVAIVGPNGSGKTNLLLALYYLLYTKVYNSSLADAKNIKEGEREMSVIGEMESNKGVEKISIENSNGKRLYINEERLGSFREYLGRYHAVMVTPDDIKIINGNSDMRRGFMDGLLSKLDKAYLESLLEYNRHLKRRNAYLKNQKGLAIDSSLMDVLDKAMMAPMKKISETREIFFPQIEELTQNYYGKISGDKDEVSLELKVGFEGNINDLLERNRNADITAARTSQGVHKGDIHIAINGLKAKDFASQGQKKSILFALKLSEWHMLQEKLGEPPLLLLDDIYEKLDDNRIANLMKIIEASQTIITDTSRERIEKYWGDDVEFIEMGTKKL